MLPAPIPENDSARVESLQRMLLSSLPNEEELDRVTRTAQRLFGAPIVLITLVDRDRQWFKSCIGLTVRETPRAISFCGHAIVQDEPLIVEDALSDDRFADNPLVLRKPKIRSYAGRTLRNSENFAIGTLCVLDRKPRKWSAEARQTLDDLGHWVEAIFATTHLSHAQRTALAELELAKQDATMDPLLHVWNRCAIVDILHREAKRALRNHDPLSVLMVDVDHSDSSNKRYAHPTNDEVLEVAARAMRTAIRPYDAVGRYEGDEFMVVLPESDRTVAAVVADRLRRKIEDLSSAFDSTNLSCKVSTGTASIEKSGGSHAVDVLVASADEALHSAKHDRRDHELTSGATPSGSHGSRGPARPDSEPADNALVGNPLVIASRLQHLRACIRDE
jgi:diguanylate cyclase (GGDEF)-like protein